MKHYCSYFPDAFLGVYLKNMCKQHDEGYAEVRALRLKHDQDFKTNIQNDNTKTVGKYLAKFLYLMTRVFGRLFV